MLLGKKFLTLVPGLLSLNVAVHAANLPSNSTVAAAATLRDSSKIVGTFGPGATISFQNTTVGTLVIPFTKLGKLDVNKDGSTAALQLLNGDHLKGEILSAQIDMDTLVGPLSIPMTALASLKTRGVASISNIVLGPDDWKALVFPVNSDWPGDKGVLSTLDDEAVHLNGQPVRTINTYKLPLQIDCDFTLNEALNYGGGYLTINAAVPGAADNELPTHMLQLNVTTITDQNQGKMVTTQTKGSFPSAVIIDQPACSNATVGVVNHLRIIMTLNGWTVKLNDAPVITEKFTPESDEVQFDLWNWQPDSRWSVSKFVIHPITP